MPKPTIDERVQRAQDRAAGTLQPPEGITLDTDEERTVWGQFVRARERSAWREFDLIILAKLVKIECQIRQYQKTLSASGPIISNKRGTLVENPLLRVVDTLQRQQLAMIRSLSLTVSPEAGRTKNGGGIRPADEPERRNNVISLIATGAGIGEDEEI